MLSKTTGGRTGLSAVLTVFLALLLTAGIVLRPAAVTRAQSTTLDLDWPTYGNDLGGMRYQNVDQINKSNVAQLKPTWIFHTGVMNSDRLSFESQPIEVDGTLYVTSGEEHVFALDATTGALKWTYNPILPDLSQLPVCCGVDNRGVAVGDGRVFLGQLDATLVALDAGSGRMLWQTTLAPYQRGYTITMAPQYVDGKVLVGTAGGEFETRNSLSAYDANTGILLWRFDAVPGPGQFGHDTWAGDSWKTGGAPVWSTPTVDTNLGMVYFSTGNAGPDLNGSQRAGKNLFASSIVALDLNTGQLR